MPRLTFLLAAAFTFLTALALPPHPARTTAPPAVAEHWYVLELAGKRCGHLVLRESRDGDTIRSESSMTMKIRRGSETIDIRIDGSFDESSDGKPIAMRTRQAFGASATEETFAFAPDSVAVVTTTGGQTTRSTRPVPDGQWLTPVAAQRALTAALAKGDKAITLRTIDPSLGLRPVSITRVIQEQTTAEAFGRTVPAIKWSMTADIFPGVASTEFVSDDGTPIRSTTDLGGIKLVQVLADRDLALRPLDAPELLESTLITPSRPIATPRSLRRAVYTLRVASGDLPDICPGPGQTVERLDARTARITLSLGADGSACSGGLVTDPPAENYLVATSMLNHADPAIGDLLKKAAIDTLAPSARAERLRRFVHDFINRKDLSVGFATASEVARTRVGDCTEHAVLLAALLRAAKIPARVCTGLIYIDVPGGRGVFGYHMWTEGLYADDGRPCWNPLDATLDRPFDAAHILFATSPLADDQTINFMVAYAPLFNRLKIDVERAE